MGSRGITVNRAHLKNGRVYCMTAYVQMVVKQPDLVVREGAVEESKLAAVRLRKLLPTVDIDRWVGTTQARSPTTKFTRYFEILERASISLWGVDSGDDICCGHDVVI